MPDADLSIFVVDDTRFSAAYIANALQKAGYPNVVSSGSATEALTIMQQRPVHVLLADWMMPEMDGLELCSRVREMDEAANHFTYVILFTAKDSAEALREAFDRGIDDFINKNRIKTELLPRVYAADRIANRQNMLLRANANLALSQHDLEEKNIVDPATGIGNRRYAVLRLQDALRQCAGRGGQTCYLLLGIANLDAIRARYGDEIALEIVNDVGARLAHLVRPLDILARVAEDQFAVVAYMEPDQRENALSLRRVHDAMNHKEFKTHAGFVDVKAGTVNVVIEQKHADADPADIMALAAGRLPKAFESGSFEVETWGDNAPREAPAESPS